MATPDYSMPPWMRFDPAERMAQAVQSSRAARDRENVIANQQADTQFEQGREQTQDANVAEDRAQRSRMAAMQFADMQGYQQDVAKGVPPAQAALRHPMAFQGKLPAEAFKTPKPPVQSGFKPFEETPAQAPNAAGPSPQASAMPPAAGAPPSGAKVDPGSPWLQKPGVYTDEKGNAHMFKGTLTPVPKPVVPQKPVAVNPGQILFDQATRHPIFTNTMPKTPESQFREVPPGGVVMKNGVPVYTNTNFRPSGTNSASPAVASPGKTAKNPIPIGKLKPDDLKDGAFYDLPAYGVRQWNAAKERFIPAK